MSNEWTPEPGRWYHLALSYKQSSHKQRLYVDGELSVSATVEGDLSYDGAPVIVGGSERTGDGRPQLRGRHRPADRLAL